MIGKKRWKIAKILSSSENLVLTFPRMRNLPAVGQKSTDHIVEK